MATTEASTLHPEDVLADPGSEFRALTIESARAWLDEETPSGTRSTLIDDHIDRGRAAVRALIHELERLDPPPIVAAMSAVQRSINAAGLALARQALANARPWCPGGGTFVPEDSVDGNRITTCPVCRRHATTHCVDGPSGGLWWAVAGHRARHRGACVDEDGKVECVCGLDDAIRRINDAMEPF